MQIYISRHGARVGPFSLEEINHQLATGELTAADLGWSESSPGWKPLASFNGVIMPGGASSTSESLSIAHPISWALPRFAGFWIRALAFGVDCFIVAIFGLVVLTIFRKSPNDPLSLTPFGYVAEFIVLFLYWPALWASPMEATVAQRILGLRVVDGTGAGITFLRGLQRVGGMLVAALPAGIGFLMAAWTERKRGLHDMLAGTCVVKDSAVDRWFGAARESLR